MKQPGKHVSGSWALVTGGSSGIGEEFARQAARAAFMSSALRDVRND
jgi:NAD(P)-dependent dehydrogenase (short-subunit alcohol dehydrogenase family)